MENYQQQAELLDYLEEYAGFFEDYAQKEAERLTALKSNTLNRIEKALSAEQAMVMEMGNREKRRAALQEAAGFSGKTFREIAAALPDELKSRCEAVMERMNTAIEEIKAGNLRCEEVAKEKMAVIARVLPESERLPGAYSPYQKKSAGSGAALFESKV